MILFLFLSFLSCPSPLSFPLSLSLFHNPCPSFSWKKGEGKGKIPHASFPTPIPLFMEKRRVKGKILLVSPHPLSHPHPPFYGKRGKAKGRSPAAWEVINLSICGQCLQRLLLSHSQLISDTRKNNHKRPTPLTTTAKKRGYGVIKNDEEVAGKCGQRRCVNKADRHKQASTFFFASCEQNFLKASFLRNFLLTIYSILSAPPLISYEKL